MMRHIGGVRWATGGDKRNGCMANKGNMRGVMDKPKPLKGVAGRELVHIRAVWG